ncbi:MAG: signal peptidase II [Burkholderiales bacterium]
MNLKYNKPPLIRVWIILAALVVVADQMTKAWILQHFALGDSLEITSFFNLVRAHNPGAAFSFLASASGWQRWLFTGIGLCATALIIWQLYEHRGQKLISAALALIMGGALGNVLDRLQHGYVVDFLDFYAPILEPVFHGGHFPAFNVADAAISLGAVGLIIGEIRRGWNRRT